MTDDRPPGTAGEAPRARPEPTRRRRFSFRIRGLMGGIVVIASWLGLFRASPLLAVPLSALAVPTLLWYRCFMKDAEREAGGPIGLLGRILFLALAVVASIISGLVVIMFVYALIRMIALGLGLDD